MATVGLKIAEGDIDVDNLLTDKDRMLKNRQDEIGTLASMFNKLISGTREQAKDAQRIAEGDLTVDVNLKSDKDLLGLSLRELVGSFPQCGRQHFPGCNPGGGECRFTFQFQLCLISGAPLSRPARSNS